MLNKYTMTISEEKDLKIYIEKLKKETEIMRKLSTVKGFHEYYFETLKKYKTNYHAFNKVNKLYLNLFGEKRYDNFLAFKKLQGL